MPYRPRPCTGAGIRSVINNSGGSQSLLITVKVQLTSTRFAVWRSVDGTYVSLQHYACDMLAMQWLRLLMMPVQNYGGSRVKCGSC